MAKNVLDLSLYAANGMVIEYNFEHVPCGQELTKRDVDDNWCPHCAAALTKQKRGASR